MRRLSIFCLTAGILLLLPGAAGAAGGPKAQSGRFLIQATSSSYQLTSSIRWSGDLISTRWVWQKTECKLYPWCPMMGSSKPTVIPGASGAAYSPARSDWGRGFAGTMIRGCIQAIGNSGTNTLCTIWRGDLTNIPFSYNYNSGVRVNRSGDDLAAYSSISWFGTVEPELHYSWQRSNRGKASGWKNLSVVGEAYSIAKADQGRYLRACVRARNQIGWSMDTVCSSAVRA